MHAITALHLCALQLHGRIKDSRIFVNPCHQLAQYQTIQPHKFHSCTFLLGFLCSHFIRYVIITVGILVKSLFHYISCFLGLAREQQGCLWESLQFHRCRIITSSLHCRRQDVGGMFHKCENISKKKCYFSRVGTDENMTPGRARWVRSSSRRHLEKVDH